MTGNSVTDPPTDVASFVKTPVISYYVYLRPRGTGAWALFTRCLGSRAGIGKVTTDTEQRA